MYAAEKSPCSTSRRFIAVVAIAAVIAGCGSSAPQTSTTPTGVDSNAVGSVGSPAVPAVTNAGVNSANPTGQFRTGTATIVTPSKTFTLSLDSGFFVESLGAHGATSALWSDPNSNNVGILGDGNGGYKLSVGGDAAPNGITQNDCVANVTKDELAGIEGTFTCSGNITGTFQAH